LLPFRPFGPAHLAILAAVVAAAAALAALARWRPVAARPIQLGLAGALAAIELAWYANIVALGRVRPPHGLPLELCNVVALLAIYVLLRPRPWALELLYYLGIAGSGMALLTPNVGAPLSAFTVAAFFLTHGGVVAAALFLVWSGALRPRPRSWLTAFLVVNGYAAAVGLFDLASGTNYMFLCRKPEAPTLLDVLGPWPVYIMAGEGVALVLFAALYAPFKRHARPAGDRAAGGPGGA
jgi:hypothetical integral membrane protein (TIGR02206 family)